MTVQDKDKLDAYLKLYERQMAHYENTQSIEWKASFGIWTVLAAAVYWASQNLTADKPVVFGTWFIIAVVMIPVAVHGSWLYKIQSSEEYDKKLWSRYRRVARGILVSNDQVQATPTHVPSDEDEFQGLGIMERASWLLLQVGVTAGLSGALGWMLCRANS